MLISPGYKADMCCGKRIIPVLPAKERHFKETCKQRFHVSENCIRISTNYASLFATNVCHVMNKVDELSGVAAINDPTVALITESWLSADIPDSTVNIGDSTVNIGDSRQRLLYLSGRALV